MLLTALDKSLFSIAYFRGKFLLSPRVKLLSELLYSALPWFEFPKQPLDIIKAEESEEEDCYFVNDLTEEEIKIIATYMVQEWVGQQLASIENTRQKYSGSDFKFTSQAAHLSKLQSLQKEYERKGFHLQRLYSRRRLNEDGTYKPNMYKIMEEPDESVTPSGGGW